MYNKPITMPRWRFLMCLAGAFATGGFVIHHMTIVELGVVLLVALAIDYGSERSLRK